MGVAMVTLPPDQEIARALDSKLLPAEPLWVPLNVTIPANSALNQQSFNLNLDYDILVYALGISSEGAFSFLLNDSGASVKYMTAQVNNTSLVSAAGIGPVFPLYRPWWIGSKNNLLCDFTNLTAEENVIQIVLCAWKSQPQAGGANN